MSETQSPPPTKKKHEWMPRFWEGCDLFAWMRLLLRNRFKVHPKYIYIAVIVTIISLIHTVLKLLQRDLYGTKARRTPIKEDPIFIIGHWRTGTTLLHELMILDERHNFPNTYQCLEPNHFLLTEEFVRKYLSFLMPEKRPMDNMKAGWDRPQEDEFALCMMGQPSPYTTIAFPNYPPQDQEAFSLRGLTKRQREEWKRAFREYLSLLTYKDPRRLVLKSPTHSFRIETLLEIFPNSRFVHIVRNPYVVFLSTVNLWKTLYETHGMQVPHFRGLEEHVLKTFVHLYERVEEGRKHVAEDRFHEVRYEELTADPIGEMEKLYDQLDLGGFEELRPKLESYFRDQSGYRTNRYPHLTSSQIEAIDRNWKPIIDRYGYEKLESKGE